VDQSKRPRRRLRYLLPRDTGPRKPRRRSLARVEQEPRDEDPEPDVDLVRAIWDGDYDAIRRNYAAWGCSPPPPPSQRRD
jgi:hypothetical protein